MTIKRRTLLAGAAGLTALAAGCTTPSTPGTTSTPTGGGADGAYRPPTFVPLSSAKPEYAPAAGGVPAGYTRLPDPLVSTGRAPLPTTAPITMLLQGSPAKVPEASNAYYQQLSTALGNQFKASTTLWAEYRSKFQVMMAGNDLPDIVMIDQVPQLPKLLESKFTDLTDFLGGDAVKEYPGLASIPTPVWEVPVVNGRLWGVSRSRPAPDGVVMLGRGDLLRQRGVDPDAALTSLTSGEDLLALLGELTDPNAKVFSMGAHPVSWLLRLLLEMHGAPNGWRVTNGQYVHAYESEEMKASLEQAAKIWQAGYMHPNSVSDSGSNFVWWQAGTTALYITNTADWMGYAGTYPGWDICGFTAPKWQGGGLATKHLAPAGYGNYAAIRKQSSPDRVREILRVMDVIASPFGSKEWLQVNYGTEGTHYTLADGVPKPTQRQTDEAMTVGYLGSQMNAQLFVPGDRKVVERAHTLLSRTLPTGETDASQGLYSETATTKGAVATRTIVNVQTEIIVGRKPLSDWDAAVKAWRAEAGDAIRQELQEAAAHR